MSLRTIELSLSPDQLKDYIAPILHTIGVLKGNEVISKIELKGMPQSIPLKFTFKQEQEVSITKHNG